MQWNNVSWQSNVLTTSTSYDILHVFLIVHVKPCRIYVISCFLCSHMKKDHIHFHLIGYMYMLYMLYARYGANLCLSDYVDKHSQCFVNYFDFLHIKVYYVCWFSVCNNFMYIIVFVIFMEWGIFVTGTLL